METLFALAVLTVIVAVFYVSASRNPLQKCRRCGGKGTLPALIPGRYRPCPRCGRRGETKAWLGKD